MKHRVSKVKFKDGQDANEMLMRKLAVNFFAHGSLITTEKKAKALKSYVETLVEKTKEESAANKNFLLSNLGNKKVVLSLYKYVAPVVKDRIGGYVRLQKLNARESDGTLMSKLSWVDSIVMEEKKVEKKNKKTVEEKKDKK